MKKNYIAAIFFLLILICIIILPTKVNAADEEGNLVIVLDPGHGAGDPGAANSTYGLKEANINYKIASYAKQELETYEGVKVYLTRYANCPSIYERGEFAKNYNADLVISIHINSGAASARGAEVWVTQDNTKIEYYQKSKEVGEKILNHISNLGIRNRGVSTRSGKANEWYPSGVVKDYYGIIRYPMNYGIRSILVEHCYISNNSDCEFINSDEKLKKLGIADAKGIAEAYQLNKKSEGKKSVRKLSLDKTEINLEQTAKDEGPVAYINPIFTPTNAYNKQVDWYSSDSNTVRVWGGKIRGLKVGEATITAISKNNQRIAKCKVVVTKPKITLNDITIDKQSALLDINEKSRLNITFSPTNASDKTIYWQSSNPDVVRVWDGDIRGLKEGTSVITATSRANGKTATCKVTVKDSKKQYVNKIIIEKDSYSVKEDEAVDIKFTYAPENSANAEFEWTSSNDSILRVWGPRFRALKEGTAYIIAKTKDGTVEAKAQVTVRKKGAVNVQNINLKQKEYTVNINEAIDIPFSYSPTNATNATFNWTSSNDSILRVWGPRFRALKEGTAYVIVETTDRTVQEKIKVTVNAKPTKKVETINLTQKEYNVKVNEAIDIPFTYSPTNATNATFNWTSSNDSILRVWGPRFRALKEGTAYVVVQTTDGTVESKIKINITK